jgi:GNAT superfamily N-acetyltransferase
MGKAVIRPAGSADLAGVLALYQHLHPDDLDPDPARIKATWSDLLGSDLIRLFVADLGGTLASTCMLALIPNLTRGARPIGIIENVVTHPDHRREGLGRSVLAAALQAAWTVNCYKVMLATGSRKPETLRFYEGAGFMPGGKTFFEARRL